MERFEDGTEGSENIFCKKTCMIPDIQGMIKNECHLFRKTLIESVLTWAQKRQKGDGLYL